MPATGPRLFTLAAGAFTGLGFMGLSLGFPMEALENTRIEWYGRGRVSVRVAWRGEAGFSRNRDMDGSP